MRLAVEMRGTHGAPAWTSEPEYELWNVTSDAITDTVAEKLATRLSAGTESLIVNDPVLSEDKRTTTIQIWSEVSSVHLREQTTQIRQIAEEVLEPLGIEVPRH